jgi:hypothetical protein
MRSPSGLPHLPHHLYALLLSFRKHVETLTSKLPKIPDQDPLGPPPRRGSNGSQTLRPIRGPLRDRCMVAGTRTLINQ